MRSKATEVQQQGYNKKNKLLTLNLTVMKKMFLFAAFAGIALASCTTDEEIFAPVNQGNEIEFVAADYVHQTRASEDPQEHDLTKTFSNADFSVWAWPTGTDAEHISALQVNADGTYTGTYYWPDEDLDFAAVSPANDPRIDVDRANGATTITYTFDATYGNNQTNLMHADFVDAQNKSTSTQVALGFRHALAKLNVVVNQNHVAKNDDRAKNVDNERDIEDYQVIVKKLSIEKFDCYGTYTVTSNDQNTADNVWTGTSKDADWTIINTPTSLVKDTIDFDDNTFKATYMETGFVMPQALGDDVVVKIDYDIVTKFKSGATSTTNRVKSVNLNEIKDGSGDKITHWYTNKVITYTFTINPQYDLTPITFSATEEEWGTQGGTHTF